MIPYQLDGYEVIDARDLPEALRGHVEMFMTLDACPSSTMSNGFRDDLSKLGKPPRLYRHASGARDQCGFATSGFLCLLVEAGYIDAGYPGIRWWNEEVARFAGVDHRAARVDEFIIDFTARQFDESAPWPLIWRET